jgi:1-acyl-sn-glycerol-3-phosphate acyltransferase
LIALVIASVRTAATFAIVSLYVIVCGPPGIAIALWFRWPMILYWLSEKGVRLGFALAGIRVVCEGTIDVGRAAVYCANHASHLEAPVVYSLLRPLYPRVSGIYKKELAKTPILGKVWAIGGFVPVDRRDRQQSDQAIALAVERLRAGNSFMVFPEGTRSRSGVLQPFKKGAFVMAIAAQAPVVPVAVLGADKAMRRGSALIWPATVLVRFGEAVPTAGMTYDDRDRLMAAVRARVGAMLGQGGA